MVKHAALSDPSDTVTVARARALTLARVKNKLDIRHTARRNRHDYAYTLFQPTFNFYLPFRFVPSIIMNYINRHACVWTVMFGKFVIKLNRECKT